MAKEDYEKVFLKGGASIKDFDRWSVIDVNLNVEDLIEKVRSKEIKIGETWNLRFSILQKKTKNVRDWESTHYLVHSYKVAQTEKKNPLESNTDDDLPF